MTIGSLDQLIERFAGHGLTDEHYLRTHYARMARTVRLLGETSPPDSECQLLDLGAHWLHLATLLRLAGYSVTAADLPMTIEQPGVRSLAAELGIQLSLTGPFEHPGALSAFGDGSYDVVVLAEVLEHLAFNPLELWREICRVLRPGGRVVLTTPNYYSLPTRARSLLRFISGQGGDLPVDKVLRQPTYAHHWKEYSAPELRRYFDLLQQPLTVDRIVRSNRGGRNPRPESSLELMAWPVWALIPGLRRDLHVELVRVPG